MICFYDIQNIRKGNVFLSANFVAEAVDKYRIADKFYPFLQMIWEKMCSVNGTSSGMSAFYHDFTTGHLEESKKI